MIFRRLSHLLPRSINKNHLFAGAERGGVLFWTLTLCLVLAALVTSITYTSMKYERAIVTLQNRQKLYDIAEDDISTAIFESRLLLHTHQIADAQSDTFELSDSNARVSTWSIPQKWVFQTRSIKTIVSVTSENDKVNLNMAAPALLSAIFASYGVHKQEALNLAAAIHDWRDHDNIPIPFGAEADAYMKHSKAVYKPRNGPFQSIGELNYVKGMTPQIFSCIKDLITIYPSLSGMTKYTSQHKGLIKIIQWARENQWLDVFWPDLPAPASQGSRVDKIIITPGYYTVTATSVDPRSNQRITLEAIVDASFQNLRPPKIVAIYEVFTPENLIHCKRAEKIHD